MKKILGLFLLLALAGCGGGGDGSSTPVATPTPAGTAVSMAAFKSVFLGTSTGATYNFPSIVGSDNQGRAWSGSYAVVADGATTFESQNVTKARALVTLQLAGGTPVSSISTKYFQVADGSFYKMVSSTGVTYVPSSQTALPSIPKVGDFGTIATFTGSDGTITTVTWALNADFNGASILALSSIIKTGATVTATEVDSYYLDAAGVPTKVAISATTSGITVTLSGNKS